MQSNGRKTCGKFAVIASATTFIAGGLFLPNRSFAAILASDNAGNSAYNYGNWPNVSNGGTGFQPWTLNAVGGTSGFYEYTSTQNGGSGTGAAGQSGGIDSLNSEDSPESWGMYAHSGGDDNVFRQFTTDNNNSQALTNSEIFTASMDNGYVADATQTGGAAGVVGMGLQTSTGTNSSGTLWEIYFQGGNADYTISDGSGTSQDANLPYTDGGLTVVFKVTGPDSYTATITEDNAAYSDTISGSLIGDPDTYEIAQFHAFDANGGGNVDSGNGAYNFFVNSMSITAIPEPTSLGIVGGGLATFLFVRRRGIWKLTRA